MKTDLHNWSTIEELVKAEKRQFKLWRRWSARRVGYRRTGQAADCYYSDFLFFTDLPESLHNARKRLVRDHVRPCV